MYIFSVVYLMSYPPPSPFTSTSHFVSLYYMGLSHNLQKSKRPWVYPGAIGLAITYEQAMSVAHKHDFCLHKEDYQIHPYHDTELPLRHINGVTNVMDL